MKRSFSVVFSVVVLSSFISPSFATFSQSDRYYSIQTIKTEEITKDVRKKIDLYPVDHYSDYESSVDFDKESDPSLDGPVTGSPVPTPTNTPVPPTKPIPVPLPGDGIDIGEIIKIGTEIWKIVEKNKPVVNQKYGEMSALPANAKSSADLDTWSEPKVKVFKTSFVNGFGMTVVEFIYRVSFNFNGSFDGKGKFLSHVTVEPAKLNVAWGFTVNIDAQVMNPTNSGTKKDPVAAMDVLVNYSIDTIIKHSQNSSRFYVRGDGLFKNLSDGNL